MADVESQPEAPTPRAAPEAEDSLMRSVVADARLVAYYTASDIARRPRNFGIGLLATFTVVFVVGLILLGVSKTPVLYLRLAELSVSEMDSLLLADGRNGLPFVNYTAVAPKLDGTRHTAGSTPRWVVPGRLSPSPRSTREPRRTVTVNGTRTTVPYTPLGTTVLLVDSGLEERIGVGRAWPYRQIGWTEVQVLDTVLDFIGIAPNAGLRATLNVSVLEILERQVSLALGAVTIGGTGPINLTVGNVTLPIIGNVSITAPIEIGGIPNTTVDPVSLIPRSVDMTVADAVTEPGGKYPSVIGNVAVVDYRDIVPAVLEQACFRVTEGIAGLIPGGGALTGLQQAIDGLRLGDYALTVVVQMEEAFRFETYYKTGRRRTAGLVEWTDALFRALGIDFAGTAQYPLAISLVGFDNFNLILASTFHATTAVIVALGAILVYTLLGTNADERSFEVAMLRAQGMPQRQLFLLMTVQMAAFVLPGVLLAMLALVLLNLGLEGALTLFTHAPMDLGRFGWTAIAFPVLVGLGVPVLSNYGPVLAAMAKSLRDALDVYRNKATETVVSVQRLAELGLEPWQVLVGWVLVIGGFMVYYLVPLAFLFDEMWLFFLVFDAILLGMLFGLCLMAHTLQAPLEHGLLWLMLWGPERRLTMLIQRNFKSHRRRNANAFIMITIAAASVIFGGVLFTLLSRSIGQLLQVFFGADLTVRTTDFDTPINRTVFDEFLPSRPDAAVAWSYATFALSAFPQFYKKSRYGNLIGFPERSQYVVGLDKSYLDAVFPEFATTSATEGGVDYGRSSTGVTDVVRSLYDTAAVDTLRPLGRIYTGFPPNQTRPDTEAKYRKVFPALLAASATPAVGVKAGSYGFAKTYYSTGLGEVKSRRQSDFLLGTRALMRKLSGYPAISTLRFSFWRSQLFVSLPAFSEILRANEIDYPNASRDDPQFQYPPDAVREPVLERLVVRLNDGLSKRERERFINEVKTRTDSVYHQTVDTAAVVASVRSASDLALYFFYFTSAIAVLLNTLMLWLTFVSNVQIGAWSFAVLRSLGFTVGHLRRAFIYEALALVGGALIMGTLIGCAVAITLVLQMNLFLQLPLQFAFPWGLFFFMVLLSLATAALAPSIPVRHLASRPISSVLKGG